MAYLPRSLRAPRYRDCSRCVQTEPTKTVDALDTFSFLFFFDSNKFQIYDLIIFTDLFTNLDLYERIKELSFSPRIV